MKTKVLGAYTNRTVALIKTTTFIMPTGYHDLYITSLFFLTEGLAWSSFYICGHCSAKSLSHLDTED